MLRLSVGVYAACATFTFSDAARSRERSATIAGFWLRAMSRSGASSKVGGAIQFTDAQADAIRSKNSQFPFKFQRSPLALSAQLSIPIFDNFNREERVQQAAVNREDAVFNVKAKDLALTADVTQAFLTLRTAAQTVALQEINASKAKEELAFAEERYKVGASTFLDVVTSRGSYEQALIDRVNAVYLYHKAFAALENAVGRPLR